MEQTGNPLQHALQRLGALIDDARRRGNPEAGSAALATADAHAHVSVRMIYVLEVAADGLAFMASVHSGKGIQMQQNPRIALCMFWPELQEQVTVEGDAELLDEAASDYYWSKRLRDDQLGTWLAEDARLHADGLPPDQDIHALRRHFREGEVPRPDAWRAFLLRPDLLRFWSTGWHRTRRPQVYRRAEDGSWTVSEVAL